MAYATPNWREECDPKRSPEELLQGFGGDDGFRLTERDLDALDGIFENNYMLSRHIMAYCAERGTGFTGRQFVSRRMVRLFRHGLVARAKISPTGRGTSYEYVYSLAPLGFNVLLHSGSERAEEVCDYWKPPHR